ncbi:uncharacterized protein EAF01_002801 [Botrytis porri]|uniref:Uncharacterized protein n=1 Tax=Botrytis porri TaxID=87229 RepID=A0A4Z1K9K1_9HELO|nr:uncharacterized protein EAF01_002801 [Botrytis porri]KAF7911294.1 hypothetical protein EAF01_002801 [Botrytis porri]TGO82138.1 hypothetical protein BPOR_0911g00030 [Botrytis porri]
MENRNVPKPSGTKRSPLSPPNNLEAINSSDTILPSTSNILDDEIVQQTPFSGPYPASRRSEPSIPAEITITSTAHPSPLRHEKHQHPPRESKERTSNLSSPSPNPSPHNPNSTTSNPAEQEPNSDSESKPPSEHSSGSDAAFYCSVGSPSEDEEDGFGDSLGRAVEREAEGDGIGESFLTKRDLREAVSMSGTDGEGMGEEDNDDGEEEEEENDIHNKDSKRRKSEKRFTFLKRLFSRKKARNSGGGAGGS